jgi:hypothetical protein
MPPGLSYPKWQPLFWGKRERAVARR